MVRHCDVAVAKQAHAVRLINRESRLYDCYVAVLSGYRRPRHMRAFTNA